MKNDEGNNSIQNDTILEISIFVNGDIHLYGKQISLSDLELQFKSYEESGATVYYYREAAESEPHPNAMKVLELIFKYGLSLTFSSKPDFSDSIDQDGKSHPRLK